jgi:hypothetical protein
MGDKPCCKAATYTGQVKDRRNGERHPCLECLSRWDISCLRPPCRQKWNKANCVLFFLIRLVGGGVQLGPLGMVATDWPVVACPEWLWWWRIRWNEDWHGKPKYSEKTHPSATLSTTDPTWPDPGSNLGCCSGKPATNCFSYGMA